MATFEIKRNPANQLRPLLICPVHEMEFVVMDAFEEPTAQVVPKKYIYAAVYRSGRICYFFLKTDGVGTAMKKWSGNLVLEGIRYFTKKRNLGVISKVTNLYTKFDLYADKLTMYYDGYPFDDPGEF